MPNWAIEAYIPMAVKATLNWPMLWLLTMKEEWSWCNHQIHSNGNCNSWHIVWSSKHRTSHNFAPKQMSTLSNNCHIVVQNKLSFEPLRRNNWVKNHSSSHDSSYHNHNTLYYKLVIMYCQHFQWNDTNRVDLHRNIQCRKYDSRLFDHNRSGPYTNSTRPQQARLG